MTGLELSPETITQIGFPICVTIYLLYERSVFNSEITKSIVKITETLKKLEEKLDWGKLNK